MNRTARQRALLILPLLSVNVTGAGARAQQTVPAPSGQNPAVAAPAQVSPLQNQPASGQNDLNPAAQRYGLPRNPTIGGPVDTDLTKPLTLERAVRIGLARQDTIAIAQTQIDSANARVVQARSQYYPQVTPTIQYQSNLQPGVRFNSATGTTSRGSFNSDTRTDVIAARQLLYDTGKREASVGFARRSAFGSEYGLANQRQSVILTVTEGYYNLLRDRELVRESIDNAGRARVTRDVIQAQADVGSAAQSDVLQAEADYANARTQIFVAQANYGVSQASLKNSMGVVTSQPVVLPDDPIQPPNTAPDALGLEPYVRLAYNNRLDIKQLREQVNAQGYNVRIANINAGPTVTADITEGYALDPNAGEQRTFFVGISYPLFDGGNTRAAVRESRAGLEQDRRSLDALEQNVRFSVEQSYVNREQDKQRIISSQLAVNAAQQNYDVALEKQRNQLVNIPEVTLAENQLVNARVSLVQAIYDFFISESQLKRAIGVNDPVFLPKVPGARPPVLQPR